MKRKVEKYEKLIKSLIVFSSVEIPWHSLRKADLPQRADDEISGGRDGGVISRSGNSMLTLPGLPLSTGSISDVAAVFTLQPV